MNKLKAFWNYANEPIELKRHDLWFIRFVETVAWLWIIVLVLDYALG